MRNFGKVVLVGCAVSFVVLLSAATYAAEDENLAAYWKFDEGKGNTVKDSSDNNNSGKIIGAQWDKGISGSALRFDGEKSKVEIKDSGSLNPEKITITSWIKPSASYGQLYPRIVDKISKLGGYRLGVSEKGVVTANLTIDGTETGINSKRKFIPPHTWTFLALTFDGNSLRLYIDGRLNNEIKKQGLMTPNPGRALYIGYQKDRAFEGVIDEVRIYSKALSAEAIESLYSSLAGSAGLEQKKKRADKKPDSGKSKQTYKSRLKIRDSVLETRLSGKSGSFCLTGISNLRSKVEFLSPHIDKKGIWELELVSGSSKRLKVNPLNAGKDAALSSEKKDKGIILRWSNIPVADESDALDVVVSIKPDKREGLSLWKIKVTNRSKEYGLWSVDFPRLRIGPVSGKGDDDYLIFPLGWGKFVKNPYKNIPRTLTLEYPSHHCCMQFMALYDGKGNGLYLGTEDPEGYVKRYVFSPDSKSNSLTYMLRIHPENTGVPGNDYDMSFPAVVGVYNGSWYEAAQLYRPWALKQKWCRKGPLAKRDDVPQWFKKLGAYGDVLNNHHPNELIVKYAKNNYDAFGGIPVLLRHVGWWDMPHHHGYPQLFPPVGGERKFKKRIKAIQDYGIYIILHVNGMRWDTTLDSYKREKGETAAIRNRDGTISLQEFKGWKKGDNSIVTLATMCPGTELWQKKVKYMVSEIVGRYKTNGVYIDEAAALRERMCFNPEHGHPVGSGKHWINGIRELLEVAYTEAKRLNPQTIIMSESNPECYIDVLDSFLLVASCGADLLPLWSAVYGGYAISSGRYWSPFRADTRAATPLAPVDYEVLASYEIPQSLRMKAGQLFVYGGKVGERIRPWFHYPSAMSYLNTLVRYHTLGMEFLVLGRMMKPITFEKPGPEIFSLWRGRDLYVYGGDDQRHGLRITMPAVQSSAWKSPDGALGLFFTNVSEANITVKFKINLSDYELEKAKFYVVEEVDLSGSYISKVLTSRELEEEMTVRAQGVKFLRVKPENRKLPEIVIEAMREVHTSLKKGIEEKSFSDSSEKLFRKISVPEKGRIRPMISSCLKYLDGCENYLMQLPAKGLASTEGLKGIQEKAKVYENLLEKLEVVRKCLRSCV